MNDTTLPSKVDKTQLEGYITWEQMEEAFKEHRVSPPPTPIPKDHPSRETLEALRVVGELAEDYEALKDRLSNLEDDINSKVNTDDLANLVSNVPLSGFIDLAYYTLPYVHTREWRLHNCRSATLLNIIP